MRADYLAWLKEQGYAENTQAAQMHRVRKVEEVYGEIDELVRKGSFDDAILSLTYSTADERDSRPNPSRLKFDGNIRNNLQSYKNAALRYARFMEEMAGDAPAVLSDMTNSGQSAEIADAPEKQRLTLERDMQTALRQQIASLESGLRIIDDGDERGVHSGFIDILCEDEAGALVVVELKAGRADARVFSQILGYMGDMMKEEPDRIVRGIIVAHSFDKRASSAARAVQNVQIFRYSINFTFETVRSS